MWNTKKITILLIFLTRENFVYVNIPIISKNEWHPFTISSPPSDRNTKKKFEKDSAGILVNLKTN